jgi:hypothetical protein
MNRNVTVLPDEKICTARSELGCNAAIIDKNKELYFGRNLDVAFKDGFWVLNQRNINKIAYMPFDHDDEPIVWVSKFGSITMNAIHLDIPLGGMNETGLVVEHLALQSTNFPKKDNRKAITPFQWIQYQLDNFSTVDEVLNAEDTLRINPWIFEFMHFLICDAQGNMAIIEYQKNADGNIKRFIYNSIDFPKCFWALGNAPYVEHIDFMRQFKGFGGDADVPTDKDTISKDTRYQFAISAKMLKDYDVNDDAPLKYLFDIMRKIHQEGRTQVSIVYQPVEKTITFNTVKNSHERVIDFKNFDFT